MFRRRRSRKQDGIWAIFAAVFALAGIGSVLGKKEVTQTPTAGVESAVPALDERLERDNSISGISSRRDVLESSKSPTNPTLSTPVPTSPPSTKSQVLESTAPIVQRFAPEPRPTTRTRTPSEVLRIQKFVPAEVTLTQSIGFPVMHEGRDIGVVPVSKGLRAKVKGLAGDKLLLEYNSRRQTVPLSSTDFLDRLIAEAEK